MKEQAIGIFDSGIGGLTVANAIRKLLPGESLLYFGDTAHLPYGDKSPELIRHYASRITHFLRDRGCKAIVIACNTASAQAYQSVVDACGPDIPVINVVDPVAKAVAENAELKGKRVGVIATKGTIASRVYPRRIQRLNKDIHVASLATPLLAPMIEEGFFSNTISQTIIASYLSKPALKDISALILGCTHYPLIKKQVKEFYGSKIPIFDSTTAVAMELKRVLEEKNLLAEGSNPEYHFMVSDKTPAFEKSTRYFFKEKITLEEQNIWNAKNLR